MYPTRNAQEIRILSFRSAVFLWTISIPVSTLIASPKSILDLVPADSLVVYSAKPYEFLGTTSRPAGAQAPDAPSVSSIATIITFLDASGLIPNEGQVFADIAAALPLLGRFEHAIALLDVSSKLVELRQSDEPASETRLSLRLNQLSTAVIFRSSGEHRTILQQLNRVVGRYTNDRVARLSDETIDGQPFQRLRDARLPGWAVWEWGRLGDYFVLSFGEGAFVRIAETFVHRRESLARSEWYSSAASRTGADKSLAQWFIAFQELRKRLGSITEDRVARVAEALQASSISHDLWSVGEEGRALSWYRCYRRDGADVVCCYSDPKHYPEKHRAIIPDAARHVAVIKAPTRWLIDSLPRAWLAAQSQSANEKWKLIWNQVEQDAGIDINGSLTPHLGEHVVLFDYPPHPLDIPFALTLAIEINDARSVRMATNAILQAWSRYLDERADRTKNVLLRMKVKHADDDIWYLQAGILGPAMKVTKQYIVISWSPEALRTALLAIEGPEKKTAKP